MQINFKKKLKGFLILTVIFYSYQAFATNYYVSSLIGDDKNNGLSDKNPFYSIQKAADLTNPGDTVFVMNGTYVNSCDGCDVVVINRSGNAANWIVYINYPGHLPLLHFNSWGGFIINDGAAYIEINGFNIQGNIANETLANALLQNSSCGNPNNLAYESKYNGNGISTEGRANGFSTGHPHHIHLLNNKIFECGGAGISAIQSDYVTSENNIIYNNCWHTLFGASGISYYQNWDLDNNTSTYKMIIRNNKLFGNRLYVPWIGCCCISDGNGVIIDDAKNTQNNSPIGPYKGKTLVTNNISFNNGGSGMHAYSSENVDFVNNTLFQNSQSTELDGEIFANASNNVNILNNIIYPINNNVANQQQADYSNNNAVYDYNNYFNTNAIVMNGTHDVIGDPKFVNPVLDLSAADFHILSGSAAIGKGSSNLAPSTDFDNNKRNLTAIDIGAYQFISNILPINISALTAVCGNNQTQLQWKVYSASNIKSYSIQGSVDGINWITLHQIDNTTSTNEQTYLYNLPTNVNEVYRVAVNNSNASTIAQYTNVVNPKCSNKNIFEVYPNPFISAIEIAWPDTIPAGKWILTNAAGQILLTKIVAIGSSRYQQFNFAYLAAGNYFLAFISNDGTKWVQKLNKIK